MEVLLCSEAFVKSATGLSDNIYGKYIRPALREAQEVSLRNVLGDCLTDALKSKVADDSIADEANAPYRELLDRAQYFLAYAAVADICPRVAVKVTNFGMAKSTDEHLSSAGNDEAARMEYFYASKADSALYALQGWILDNAASFPELRSCDCGRIRACLTSAASCGIWLGGRRGLRRWRRRP